MSSLLDTITDTKLRSAVASYTSSHPEAQQLIDDLIKYFISNPQNASQANGSESKKRKLDSEESQEPSSESSCTIQDISFLTPRKKLSLGISDSSIILKTKDGKVEGIYPLKSVRHLLCVPTPDKQKPQYTFILFSQSGNTNSGATTDMDAIVFTVADDSTIQMSGTINQLEISKLTGTNREIITQILEEGTNRKVTIPDFDLFESKAKAGLAKSVVKRAHINCYLKSKEGHLYLLPSGLFFGFKKPLLFLPIHKIDSMNVLGITSRTFDLSITMKPSSSDDNPQDEEKGVNYEFSMIDYDEFDPIMGYIDHQKIASKAWEESLGKPVTDSQEGDKPGDHDEADNDEEDDEDFCPEDDQEDVAEEFDSEHDSENSDNHESDEGEGEDEDEDMAEVSEDVESVSLNESEDDEEGNPETYELDDDDF
ncbi:Rtt106-domain-containing protein [Basidiobolus meristosporus CBS 931.73]|uniref:Rtt106-domain-containing protein n=1 Tax=Basidiobolus meristosporus CBS 931.73 TaxID=1314790 RepID=A0A1Y1Z7T8_9FUNG|nr:Rtt106-domain-containing protein [Basidiobolus meristosporus CBS 931.73]|eukprot:ORY05875.1 Rtt106-domain-containing protein [Basidiobolus meristosporus CBS 931.73]